MAEALFEAVRRATQLALAKDEERGKNGDERKLPASYRLVIYGTPDGKSFPVPTADGPQPMPAEVARRLLEDAEVLHLELPQEAEQKLPSWGVFESQVSAGAHPRLEEPIEHAGGHSTVDKPAVPAEERDRPTDAELLKRILSRDPICRVPGCGHISERGHHIQFLEHGGRTCEANLVGICGLHHDLVHAGLILMSGTAYDLRVSDANRRPLISFPVSQESPIQIESERPEVAENDLLDEDPECAAPCLPARLPAEIDRDFWRAHRRSFEWSEKREALVYRPEPVEDPLVDSGPAAPATPPANHAMATPSEFQGQRRVVENLSLALKAARLRKQLPPPILLSGPPGLGKSTLSKPCLPLRSIFPQNGPF